MLRIICVVFYMVWAFSASSQNQPNPFDLKYRNSKPNSAVSTPAIDSSIAKTPITQNEQDAIPAKNPKPVVDSAAQNEHKRISTNSEMNPFDKETGPEKTPQRPPEKPSQGTSDVQFHTNPTVTPTTIGSRHMSKGIQIFFILLSLLFLIFIVNVERNFVKDLWRVISNENYSSLHLRNQRNTMRQILLIMGYTIFLIQAGIFLWQILVIFQYSGVYLDNIWACIGIVVLIYAIRHLVIRYLRWLFNNEKEMSLFGFDISTFNIMVGLVLLPVNVVLNFGPDSMAKPLVIIGLIVMVVAYLMRQLRWMLTARQLIANSLFLFFVYLCAVEILPLWAVLTYFR